MVCFPAVSEQAGAPCLITEATAALGCTSLQPIVTDHGLYTAVTDTQPLASGDASTPDVRLTLVQHDQACKPLPENYSWHGPVFKNMSLNPSMCA